MSSLTNEKPNARKMSRRDAILDLALRVTVVALLLFIFLVGIKTFSGAFKMMGSGFAKTLFNVGSNPVVSLLSGLLATALIQSSSATTSIIVGLVSAGSLPVGAAVPMIMGANLGTSVTNTIVSLAYMKKGGNFKSAFAAATVHDFFNVLSVAVLLPIEIATGFLEKMATASSAFLYGSAASMKFTSPLKAALKPVSKGIKSLVTKTMGLEGTTAGIVLTIIAAVIVIVSLSYIVKTMKVIVESNQGDIIEKLLSSNPYVAIGFGIALTIFVQSSSITTSLLVPMAGSGLLSIASILPVTLGANIGTTCTALLASLTGNMAGLTIALVHFFFNIAGSLIWFPVKRMREVPVKLAEGLGATVENNKLLGLAYIVGIFFLLPALAILI